jgi:outer membrane protein assembly factor BamB
MRSHVTAKRTMGVLLIASLIATCCLLCACGSRGTQQVEVPEKASLGIVYSAEGESASRINWFDTDLNVIGESPVDYPNLGANVGFQNACYADDSPILLSQNEDTENVKVIALDPETGKLGVYPLDKIGPTDWTAEPGHVAVMSNLNGESFASLLALEDGSWVDLQAPDGLVLQSTTFADGKVYAVAMDMDDHWSMLGWDPSTDKMETLIELQKTEEPTHLTYANGGLYFVSNDELVRFDLTSSETKSTPLTRSAAFHNLHIDGDTIWIAYTDIHSENGSLIEQRDLKTGEVLARTDHAGSIWQMEARDGTLYVLGFGNLSSYQLSADGQLEKTAECPCEDSELLCAGFFLVR